ncbi:ComEC/Rec2 family competence protein [Mangrovimonas futianensis]|uniref:ComEC/Rec2 family competence protein n=1 Tax=Mangrovimonas futianensis TaxID=2895523 RepID=UPI001E3C4711|nr:ComEC/Rec2 family competence protein [Mangrovimonas futianensis]MCF1420294.1 ComEC family competence protein [Mangrovimonas futianensis]
MKALNFILIKLTLCLVLGIWLSRTWQISLSISALLCSIFILAFTIAYFYQRNSTKNFIWFGFLGFATMILIGCLTENIHKDLNNKNHYLYSEAFQNQSPTKLTFKIKETLKSNSFSDRYVVSILELDYKKSMGDALLLVKKDSTLRELKIDDIVLSKTKLEPLKPPLNPGQFDYSAYLSNKQIYSQIYATNTQILKIGEQRSLIGLADQVRNTIHKKLSKYNFSKDELAVIQALLLGQRNHISSELYNDYTNAGAIHILAISGLHVGIILLILQWLLKPLEQFRYGKCYKMVLIIFLIWSFAVIAGLSASVTRAATMFTAIAIGLNLNRPTNTINSLAISAFVLLVLKPSFLFEVGFQLSYLAVLGIVLFQPFFDRFWNPKSIILKKFWQAATVSLSAQFGIFPLTLYYFHQIPGLFLLSNLVVIPLLGFILGLGIASILMALLNIPQNPIFDLFGTSIETMNRFFGWVSKQEPFLLKNIYFNMTMVLLSYIIIAYMYRLKNNPRFKHLIWITFVIILLQLSFIYVKFQNQQSNQLIVFHKSRQTILGIKHGRKLHIQSKDSSDNLYFLKDFKTERFINQITYDSIHPYYSLNNTRIIVIDSLGIYGLKAEKADIILLRQSPKINLKRMIDSLKPKQIIADGSNYKSYIERWKETCKIEKLPFHSTNEKGAFIINLN